MIKLFDRMRISVALSPAFLILHIWILTNSSGHFIQTYGIVYSLALAFASSLLEAFIIVTAVAFAFQIWQSKYKNG